MKLKEVLEKMQGKDIKVGANSGYFYCGNCDENTPGEVKRAGDLYISRYKKRLNKAKYHKKYFENYWTRKKYQHMSLFYKRKADGLTDKTEDDIIKGLRELKESDLDKTNHEIERMQNLIGEHQGMLAREVQDVYRSIIGDGYIIIVAGDEVGEYWTREEYDTGVTGRVKRNSI